MFGWFLFALLALAVMLAIGMFGPPTMDSWRSMRRDHPQPDRHRKLHWLRVSAAKQQRISAKRLKRSRRFIPGKAHFA